MAQILTQKAGWDIRNKQPSSMSCIYVEELI